MTFAVAVATTVLLLSTNAQAESGLGPTAALDVDVFAGLLKLKDGRVGNYSESFASQEECLRTLAGIREFQSSKVVGRACTQVIAGPAAQAADATTPSTPVWELKPAPGDATYVLGSALIRTGENLHTYHFQELFPDKAQCQKAQKKLQRLLESGVVAQSCQTVIDRNLGQLLTTE